MKVYGFHQTRVSKTTNATSDRLFLLWVSFLRSYLAIRSFKCHSDANCVIPKDKPAEHHPFIRKRKSSVMMAEVLNNNQLNNTILKHQRKQSVLV